MFIHSFVEYRHGLNISKVMEPLFGLTFEGFIKDFELGFLCSANLSFGFRLVTPI